MITSDNPREGQVMYLGILQSLERCLEPAMERYQPAIRHMTHLAEVMENDLGAHLLEALRDGSKPAMEEFAKALRLEMAGIWGWVDFDEGREYVGNPYEGSEEEREAWASGWRLAGYMSTR